MADGEGPEWAHFALPGRSDLRGRRSRAIADTADRRLPFGGPDDAAAAPASFICRMVGVERRHTSPFFRAKGAQMSDGAGHRFHTVGCRAS